MLTVHGEPLTLHAPCHSVPGVIHPHHFTAFLFTLLTGHLPFHTIAKLSTVRRKRRDVEAEGSSNKLAFSLNLSNVTHSFEMTPSTDIVSPRYVLEEVSEDGRLMTAPSTVKDCYYIQDIRQTGLSAVTVCSHTVVSCVPYCTVHVPCVGIVGCSFGKYIEVSRPDLNLTREVLSQKAILQGTIVNTQPTRTHTHIRIYTVNQFVITRWTVLMGLCYSFVLPWKSFLAFPLLSKLL